MNVSVSDVEAEPALGVDTVGQPAVDVDLAELRVVVMTRKRRADVSAVVIGPHRDPAEAPLAEIGVHPLVVRLGNRLDTDIRQGRPSWLHAFATVAFGCSRVPTGRASVSLIALRSVLAVARERERRTPPP